MLVTSTLEDTKSIITVNELLLSYKKPKVSGIICVDFFFSFW